MIWATDHTGLAVMLTPDGIGFCPNTMSAARVAEVGTTTTLRAHGYEVDAFLSVYHSMDKATKLARIKKYNATQSKDSAAVESRMEANRNSEREDGNVNIAESEPESEFNSSSEAEIDSQPSHRRRQ